MFSNRFKELAKAFEKCKYSTKSKCLLEKEAFETATNMVLNTKSSGGIVYVIGNGASAGIASHFSSDLMKSAKIPSQTLFDSNLMTCIGNDYGYEHVFSYPLSHLIKKNDLLVAISCSGKSPNILKAAEAAACNEASLLTLSGFSEENPLRNIGQLNFWVNETDYGLVETTHFFLLRTMIDLWKQSLHQVDATAFVR